MYRGSYPPSWADTVTLYNQHRSDADGRTKTVWLRTVLYGCFYGSQKRQQLDGMTLISVDTHLVRIRATENYKSPDEWHRLSLDQAPLYFTLGKGDVIVKGEVDDSIPDNRSASGILSKYPDAFEVAEAKDNSGPGRFSAHYYGGG